MTLDRRCPKRPGGTGQPGATETAETFAPSESGYQGPSALSFRCVAPGLYERIDTPRRVKISAAFAETIERAGNSLLTRLVREGM